MPDVALDERLDGFEAMRRRLAAAEFLALAEVDRRGSCERTGATSSAAELAHRHGRSRAAVERDVSAARKLRHLPQLLAALRDGRVSVDHVRIMVAARTEQTAEAMARDEGRLVRLALRSGADEFRRAVRHWRARVERDLPLPARSEWHRVRHTDGSLVVRARFTGEDAPTVDRTIETLMDEAFRSGSDRDAGADPEPVAERRAAAVVELARRGGAVDADGRPATRTRPQVVATIDHDNLVAGVGAGQFEDGTVVRAGTVRRLACDADVIAAVFGNDSELLDLARRSRLVSPAQRMALALRDRGCAFPSCDRPVGWCDAHHIHHWADGGPTDLDNLVLLCARHHHLLHEGGWAVEHRGGGSFVFTSPDGLVLHPAPRPEGRPDPFAGSERRPSPSSTPARRAPAAA